MLKKYLLVIFTACFCIQANSQSLIGSWRQLPFKSGTIRKMDKNPTKGDLIIRSDSTFHIQGDSSTQISTIPGWHAGEESNGTWEVKNKRLILRLEPNEDRLYLWFKIISLTKNKLVLRSGLGSDSKKNDVSYVRI